MCGRVHCHALEDLTFVRLPKQEVSHTLIIFEHPFMCHCNVLGLLILEFEALGVQVTLKGVEIAVLEPELKAIVLARQVVAVRYAIILIDEHVKALTSGISKRTVESAQIGALPVLVP